MFFRGAAHKAERALASAERRIAALEAELSHRGRVDARTGLLNVAAFRIEAEAALERAELSSRTVTLALIDIDGFRALNARRGASAGDAAMAEVAVRLQAIVGGEDIVGATGPDEISILMPGTALADANACCKRLVADVEAAEIDGAGFITISVGITSHRPGVSIDSLVAAAARGLDRARADGGARTVTRSTAEALNPFGAQKHVMDALAAALVERDRYTGEHSASVVGMAKVVATALGLDAVEVQRIGHAAKLHDIGKVAIPDHVLKKPGPLNDDEWELMREHPAIGERILRAIPGIGGIARIVRHEHERFDGSGYPDGLRGDDIPAGSRIILACDAYHAMTSNRPYRAAMSHDDAMTELRQGAGSQFDPTVVEALGDHLGRRASEPTPLGAVV